MSQQGIEQFSVEQFEAALTAMSTKGKVWQGPEIVKGELVYFVPVLKTPMRLVIRSSIDPKTQVAKPVGADSLKVRVQYQSNGSWREFGKVRKQHVTRQTGWQERLKTLLRETYKLAAAKHNERLTATRNLVAAAAPATTSTPAVEVPECPKCGAKMVLRTAKRGKNAGNKFWGCSKYFATKCNGSRQYQPESETPAVPTTTTVKTFKPTPQQEAIFDFIVNGTGNAVIEAVAGAGKTTTIVQALKLLSNELEIAFVCFNVKIRKELARRAPAYVFVSTLNSLGNGNVKDVLKGARFNQYKLLDIVDGIADEQESGEDYDLVKTLKTAVVRLVNLVKANMLDGVSRNMVDQLADKYGINIEDEHKQAVTSLTQQVLAASIADSSTYDYSDQIYWSAMGTHGVTCKQFDVVFVDEAQDLNKAQIAMLLKTVKSTGRVIAVGDRYQSIYGFRGADIMAIPNLIAALNATTLPLSLTFRCPKSHVRLAQELVPHIEALPTAPEGVLEYVSGHQALSMYKPADLVLCRCNAPLVEPAFALIRQGIKAIILGRDIGQGLIALVEKVQRKTGEKNFDKLLDELDDYARQQIARLNRRKKANQAQVLEDKVETIMALAEDCFGTVELFAKIEAVFSDEQQGVVFSSVHKAKGSEAERVFVLKPNLLPHPKATSDWQLEQERNVKYVALTRSKAELYIVNDPKAA